MWYVGDDVSDIKLDEQDFDFYGRNSPTILEGAVPSVGVSFEKKLKDKNRGLALFGTVPPPKKLEMGQVRHYGSIVGGCIRDLRPDAFIVYDIQDEKSRNGKERPFPFVETHDPRQYAEIVGGLVPHVEPIIFKALVPGQDEEFIKNWCQETTSKYHSVVFVGGSPVENERLLTVNEASEIAKVVNSSVNLGGIVIPERHRDKGDEPKRLADKVARGASFFTSQIVYSVDNVIALLRDYSEYCKENNVQPVRLIFTFAPFGSANTITFFQWLGVEIPPGTVQRALRRPTLQQRVDESVEICRENWKHILDAMKRQKLDVPIGFSVESVTKSKTEQDAAMRLFQLLKEEMNDYYLYKGQV